MKISLEIQKIRSELSAIDLASQRLGLLEERLFQLEDHLDEIREQLEIQHALIERDTLDSNAVHLLEKARFKYLELSAAQRQLSERVGMIIFEKSILAEKINGATALENKLMVLTKMRARQLEGMPVSQRAAIQQINKKADAEAIIKSELDQIIQLGYRVRVKLSDLVEKLNGITFWTRLKTAIDTEQRKVLTDLQHQSSLVQQLIVEFEDTIDQLNRLQTQQKFTARLSKETATLSFQPLSREWLTNESINRSILTIQNQISEVDQLMAAFKIERADRVKDLSKLERQRKKFLLDF